MSTSLSNHVHLVVMAGGSGTRFWPKSTSRRPKQLLTFGDEDSLLRKTVHRLESRVPSHQQWIVTTAALAPAVRDELGHAVHILAEPQARNTAPCVYWAARTIYERDPMAVMVVLPADHLIRQVDRLVVTLDHAVEWAVSHDELVTLGVKPTRPETGYGYLKLGKTLSKRDVLGSVVSVAQVEQFVEKPSFERATKYLESGQYLWNGGMFVWRAETILRSFDEFLPEYRKVWDSSHGQVDVAYPRMTATSIDFGIMEKSSQVVTVPLDCGWDDLGSWTSVETLDLEGVERIPLGTVIDGEAVGVASTGNVVDVHGRLVALLGVKDLIVVSQGDAILVADKNRAQEIKSIVEEVRKVRPDLV